MFLRQFGENILDYIFGLVAIGQYHQGVTIQTPRVGIIGSSKQFPRTGVGLPGRYAVCTLLYRSINHHFILSKLSL